MLRNTLIVVLTSFVVGLSVGGGSVWLAQRQQVQVSVPTPACPEPPGNPQIYRDFPTDYTPQGSIQRMPR
jgi:hypothetical protein